MYKLYQPVLGLMLVLSLSKVTHAQPENQRKQKFPISVSLANQSWALPFSRILRMAPFYPGINFGTELCYKEKEKFKFYQSLELGGFINRTAGSAFYFNSDLGIRAKFKRGWKTDFAIGLGYFHGFHPSYIYAQQSDGTFLQVKDRGVGAMSANFKIGLEYGFKSNSRELTIITAYQWIASTYYWSLIGIRPNSMLHIGAKANLFKSSQ